MNVDPLQVSLYRGRLLRLSAPLPEDAEIIARWSEDSVYMRMLDDDPVHLQRPESDLIAGGPNYFHLRTLEDDQFIGFAVLFNIRWPAGTAMMAMGIGEPGYRGRGYGSDALRLLLGYGFRELGLHRIGLTVIDYNHAAIRAYERAGFVMEGTERDFVLREGQRYHMLHYGILRDEWEAKRES